MTKVTKEMINAAHDVTMKSKLMLGHELLEKIYLAMDSQRTWVSLTTDEIDKAWRSVDYTKPWDVHRIDVAHVIETKLKEKNT